MLNLSAKKLSSLIDSPKSSSKEKTKPIMRKPQTTSFSRKANQQILMAESISITRAPSRDKTKSQFEKLVTCKSLKELKAPNAPQIKYLSPKNLKESRINTQLHLIHSQKTPRFTRTNTVHSKNPINLSFASKISQRENQNSATPQISQISLESVLNKETLETMPHTDDWSALERENRMLKEQNAKLRQQNYEYLQKIECLSNETVLWQPNNKKSLVTATQNCKNCMVFEEKIKMQIKYLSLYESNISQKQREIEKLREELFEAQCQGEKEREKYVNLHQEYRTVTTKYLEGERTKMEFISIIESLNAKLESHQQNMRYFSIQQSMLLKKKHQNQQWKAEAARLATQKKALKDLVATYKQRIDIIRNVNKNNKLNKSKSQKEIYYQDLFELSSEQSDRDP